MNALYRLLLYAYPAGFRREYGDAMQQALHDQLVHDQRSAMQIFAREIADVARTAPRMRWESPMTRLALILGGVTAAIAAVIVGGPLSVVLIVAVVAIALLVRAGRDRGVEVALRSRRWMPCAALAVITLGAAVAIAQLADGELSEVWWSLMAVCLLVGIATAVVAIAIVLTNRPADAPSPRGAR